jgi:hypothetical protein
MFSKLRMFTNRLLESAKDESSCRTVVEDVKTKSPLWRWKKNKKAEKVDDPFAVRNFHVHFHFLW